jgi:transmembrane sensor
LDRQLPIIKLFVKYLQNQCTVEEVRRLLQYFEVEENEETLKALIRAELDFNDQGKISVSKENAALAKVKTHLLAKIHRQDNRSYTLYRWLKICAILLMLVGTGSILYRSYTDNHKLPKLLSSVTGQGQRRILTLTDGTKIWLSPSSSLQYPDQFIGNSREVKLEGEAFFEVTKDKKHPFIIHSDGMDTRVVGTSFNIQSFKRQRLSTVTVVTGVVKVSAGGSSNHQQRTVVLTPNQQSRFDRNDGRLTLLDYQNAKWMLKRKQGILNYDGAPVLDVVADLERYYQLKIDIVSKSKNCLCYGEFDTNRPAKIVLAQLAAAINASVTWQGNRYIIKGGCEE